MLGKTYDAIADFYSLNQADFADQPVDSEASKDRDAELEALVRSGNFNKLYSKFLLEKRVILKTPERAEDVHGAWREYFPGDEEALAKAADGTPWCVASPAVGKNYLETGRYGEGGYHNGYNTAEAKNKAKFILFHLQDPETGMLAENACASIRLDTDGRVAEISGLDDGQALEDALVPEVEAKVRTLPGGEKFLEAFADKQHLIAMDRKMQAGEYDFSQEDLEFIFEQKRKIANLDTYSFKDPRINELRVYILQDTHFAEHYPEGLSIGGDLNLSNTHITELPEGLSVSGDLDLYETKITELPENLSVGGYLDLQSTNITKLPEGLRVGGDLNLRDTKITELPEELSVGGRFVALWDTDITKLPKRLSVGGDLDLRETQITELPEELHVGGNLDLRGTEITELPEDLSVGGGLNLRFTDIAELPDGLTAALTTVCGDLDLVLSKVTDFPEGLSV